MNTKQDALYHYELVQVVDIKTVELAAVNEGAEVVCPEPTRVPASANYVLFKLFNGLKFVAAANELRSGILHVDLYRLGRDSVKLQNK